MGQDQKSKKEKTSCNACYKKDTIFCLDRGKVVDAGKQKIFLPVAAWIQSEYAGVNGDELAEVEKYVHIVSRTEQIKRMGNPL